jgi:hypothetical protein
MAMHGNNYYLKGIFSSGLRVEVAENLMSRLPKLSVSSGVNLYTVFEMFPTKRILSVPNNATAYIRGSRVNVLLAGAWSDKDANKLDAVRSATAEFSRIIVESEKAIPELANTGYGNYGEDRKAHRLVHDAHIYISQCLRK